MTTLPTSLIGRRLLKVTSLVALGCSVLPAGSLAKPIGPVIDDFSQAEQTSAGYPRIVIDDASVGGQSKATLSASDGVLSVTGQLVPARGKPAFVSMVLLLSAQGEPQDLSDYEGVRLLVHVEQGGLSVLAASSEVKNFDFHAAAVARQSGGIQEIKIPFSAMKRVWSAQTPLNLGTITSINLVAAGLKKGTFTYEVDEIGFY